MGSDLAAESADPVRRVLRDVETTTGIRLEVQVHWVSAEEQAADNAAWAQQIAKARSNPEARPWIDEKKPKTKWVRLGSAGSSLDSPEPRDFPEATGYWEAVLSNGHTQMVNDVSDVVEVIQEDIIEEVRGAWPECPVHRSHPLNGDVERQAWVCPNDVSVAVEIGQLQSLST